MMKYIGYFFKILKIFKINRRFIQYTVLLFDFEISPIIKSKTPETA